jgi:hypothetical protein
LTTTRPLAAEEEEIGLDDIAVWQEKLNRRPIEPAEMMNFVEGSQWANQTSRDPEVRFARRCAQDNLSVDQLKTPSVVGHRV